jgi:hypothetical protein
MKPIGYYTSYTPGEESLLAEMQEAWGAQFQKLNNAQRLWFIRALAEDLFEEEPGSDAEHKHDDEVAEAIERFSELTSADKVGLMEATVQQLRYPSHSL